MDDGNQFKALVEQLTVVLRVQKVIGRVLKNKPSHVLLAKYKKILARETKKLLLLEREIYLSQSVDEHWESNYWKSFESIGSVLKEVTLVEKAISEKLEETSINSISVNDFTSKPSTPLATDKVNYHFSFKTYFSIIDRAEDGSSNRNCEKSVQFHQILSSHKAKSISSFRDG
ncbi:hypothetical protein MKW92_033123, partial [Papaver armeniacum]